MFASVCEFVCVCLFVAVRAAGLKTDLTFSLNMNSNSTGISDWTLDSHQTFLLT
jgi:hypothetical protein